MVPMSFGYVEGVTHDYIRHGTTTLFAAPNVLNGAVLATCKPRRRHQECLSFLREIDKAWPAGLDMHCIVITTAVASIPRSRLGWLRGHVGTCISFPPGSWPNQAERFFALITDKAIRRGSCGSVKELINRMDQFFPATTKTADLLYGSLPLTQSAQSYKDFVRESAERNTGRLLKSAES